MGLLAKPNYAYLHDCLTGCLHGHLANKRFYAQIGGRHTWLSTKGIVASKVSIKSLCTVAGFSQIIYCLSDYQHLCKQLPKLIKLHKCYSMLSCLMNVYQNYGQKWPPEGAKST